MMVTRHFSYVQTSRPPQAARQWKIYITNMVKAIFLDINSEGCISHSETKSYVKSISNRILNLISQDTKNAILNEQT